jgi:hypothetical protein
MKTDMLLHALSEASKDERLNNWHLAIYQALIIMFAKNRSEGAFSISRSKVMKLSRIKAAATYHKYIQELEGMGYIQYTPSYHPKNGSTVKLITV